MSERIRERVGEKVNERMRSDEGHDKVGHEPACGVYWGENGNGDCGAAPDGD